MQYIVNVRVPDDIAVFEGGRLRINPKYLTKSREETLAETQAMVIAITQRFPDVVVVNIAGFFVLVDMTEEVAVLVRDELGYDVAPNRTMKPGP